MKTRPTVTDEEIKGYMNFDSLLTQHQAQKAKHQKLIRKGLLFLAAASVGIITYWALPSTTPEPVVKEASVQDHEPVTTTSVTDSSTSVPSAQLPGTQATESKNDPQEKPAAKKQIVSPDKSPSEQKPSEAPAFQYQEAEPVAGYPHLYNYFSNELKYPPEALPDSIQGVVSVYFIINAEGKPEKISIQNSLGPAFAREAIRLIEHMPPWKAAQLNDRKVPAKISLPITFQIVKPKAPQP